MITISLCMIVKNEEAVLGRCLASVAPAVDEIIIVDTGSTDRTKEAAKAFTDKLYDFEWINDFSAARNVAFSKASMDYQLWLDADDVVPEASLAAIQELKENLSDDIDIVTMKYITNFDADGRPILSSTRERLVRRAKNYAWQQPVHEFIPLIGKVQHTDIEIHHKKPSYENQAARNIGIFTALEASGKPMSAREQYYYARELAAHGDWIKSAYYFEQFLGGKQGWVEDNIASCLYLGLCHTKLGNTEKVVPALARSFLYDAPRPEICTEIGYHYKRAGKLAQALGWFRHAAALPKPNTTGFILWNYHGFLPNFECAVCSCLLGDFKAAYEYNEKAAAFKPNHPAIAKNRELFGGLIGLKGVSR